MAEEQENDDREQGEWKRKTIRERSRQWFLTIGTVLALLATIIGFLSDSVGVLEFLSGRISGPEAPTEEVASTLRGSQLEVGTPVALSAETTLPTETPVPSPTTAPSPTAVATATNTPLPVVAKGDERLLIVAQFTNFTTDANYNVAGRIHEALSEQVTAAQLEATRVEVWPEVVEDHVSASQVLSLTHAIMVIWGEYDSGRVRARFSLQDGGEELDWQRLLGAPDELSTTINLDLPRETQALALMALGRLYRNAGDMKGARAAFAQALAQQPSNLDTVATLTFYLAALDASANPPALDRAIDGYSRVIELRPDWFNARYNRGLVFLTRYWFAAAAADLDAAIDDFTWTLQQQPTYSEAFINRAIAFYARDGEGDLDASVSDLTSAIRYSPRSYRGYYNRGLAYIRLDRPERWVADLNKALQIAPDFWVAHHALCWGYALDQDSDAGLPHCDEAAARDASGSTRDGRGLILAQMGQLDEAAADLELYLAWLDTQPEVWSEMNNRPIYEDILAGLAEGEVRITPELLAQLR